MNRSFVRAACAAALSLLVCLSAVAQSQPPSRDEKVRIERLAALGRLWGAVKFFHPALAYRDIDWDAALVRTLPKVDAAVSTEDYRAAVNSMLAVLEDPATRIGPEPPAPADRPAAPAREMELRWTDDRIAIFAPKVLDVTGDARNSGEQLRKLIAEAQTARALVFDLRMDAAARSDTRSATWLNNTLSQMISPLIGRGFATSSIRYRLHSGFARQMGQTSGGYYSGLVARYGAYFEAARAQADRPMAFVVDESSIEMQPILGGLQAAGLATVIYDGKTIPQGGPTVPVDLTEGLTIRMRVGELLNSDNSLGFQPDKVLPAGDASKAMNAALNAVRTNTSTRHQRTMAPAGIPLPEKFYQDTPYPSRELRLLALFRFWNAIDYFFAYKPLLERPWTSVLTDYIPRMEAARDTDEYRRAIAELATELHDSHAYTTVLGQIFGSLHPPIELKWIENRSVIVRMTEEVRREAPGLKLGDIVRSVDGEEDSRRRQRMGRYFAASTPQAMNDVLNRWLLNGPADRKAVLEVESAGGKVSTVSLARSVAPPLPRQGPVYKVLAQGYGYFDLSQLTLGEIDAAFEAVKDTPALILDMRGYPRGIFSALTPRLATRRAITARIERPELHALEFPRGARKSFEQTVVPAADDKRYRGKIVMLIDEEAISQSEHTCLFIEAATDVTFIGSPTNGTDGDITSVALPGGVLVNFTGHDIRHGDGRQLQRIGIQPHIKVEPTIEGIRSGRDEVLERAIRFIAGG